MSFDYNPFEHIEVIKRSDGTCFVHCHSCGGERPKPGEAGLPLRVTAAELFQIMSQHVRLSHERTPEDFAGWSKY